MEGEVDVARERLWEMIWLQEEVKLLTWMILSPIGEHSELGDFW
jgi:hypothetical protein